MRLGRRSPTQRGYLWASNPWSLSKGYLMSQAPRRPPQKHNVNLENHRQTTPKPELPSLQLRGWTDKSYAGYQRCIQISRPSDFKSRQHSLQHHKCRCSLRAISSSYRTDPKNIILFLKHKTPTCHSLQGWRSKGKLPVDPNASVHSPDPPVPILKVVRGIRVRRNAEVSPCSWRRPWSSMWKIQRIWSPYQTRYCSFQFTRLDSLGLFWD